MKLIPDKMGRFFERPFFEDGELDNECDQIVTQFLIQKYGEVKFPISTEDLQCIIEKEADLDLYVTLGEDEEGKTDFRKKKPDIAISEVLSSEPRFENRLRTTLAHEYGHAHFHRPFYEKKKEMRRAQTTLDFFDDEPDLVLVSYRSEALKTQDTDWLEWQARYVSGALLMPINDLKPRVIRFLEQHHLLGKATPEQPVVRTLIQKVAQRYQVSADAAQIRLQQLGFLKDALTPPQQGSLL